MNKLLAMLLSLVTGFAAVLPATGVMAAVTSTISGTVTTVYEDQPVEDATITAKDPQGNIIATATTDSKGNYSLTLPVGVQYELELDPPGIYTQKSPIETPKGVMSAKAEKVDWKVSFEGAFWLFGAGATTLVGPALYLGLKGGDNDTQTGSQ